MHQLPGVTSCTTHVVDLIPFIWPSQSSYRERSQLVPTALPDAVLRPHESTGVQIGFAQISAELLGMNLPILGPERWKTAYQVAASAMALLTRTVGSGTTILPRRCTTITMTFPDSNISNAFC